MRLWSVLHILLFHYCWPHNLFILWVLLLHRQSLVGVHSHCGNNLLLWLQEIFYRVCAEPNGSHWSYTHIRRRSTKAGIGLASQWMISHRVNQSMIQHARTLHILPLMANFHTSLNHYHLHPVLDEYFSMHNQRQNLLLLHLPGVLRSHSILAQV